MEHTVARSNNKHFEIRLKQIFIVQRRKKEQQQKRDEERICADVNVEQKFSQRTCLNKCQTQAIFGLLLALN